MAIAAALACIFLVSQNARAQALEGFPLLERNFSLASPRGFGDRNNSWAQSMMWWKGNLYVGTSRQSLCTSLAAVNQFAALSISQTFADTYLPYPPPDPDLACAPDFADLSLQAEIWRWSSATSTWQRVFQSPLDLDNPGPGAPRPPRIGKKLPYDSAFPGMAIHKDPDGTEALYAFGVNTTILYDRTKLPPPRILRTTDGVNWTPVPQAPGTFLGDLPFNPDHSSFRSPVSYDGKLFVLSGPVFGQGTLIASANPAAGNNAWFQAGPTGMLFYELQTFNGWLYIGGFDPDKGYAIYKTKAQGAPPYALTEVVPPGALVTNRPAKSVVTMYVFNGRLYVGTATPTEVIRINPDDTWEVVVGPPRQNLVTGEWKYPISNLDAGFGHTLNDHAWQMSDPYNFFYIGTYNASIGSRLDPVAGPLLAHNMGAHLYRTANDWYYSPVTMNGFKALGDPQGGKFDYGIRTMANTPYGLFVGSANDHYGLMIFRALKRTSPEVEMPTRLEIEQTKTGGVLLSWVAGYRATSYRIYRAEILPIFVRDDTNFEGYLGGTGNKIPDTSVSPFVQIGTSPTTNYTDTTTVFGKRYMYYVVGQGATGALSEPSSLGTYPLLRPTLTFAALLQQVDTWIQRQRFKAPNATTGQTIRQRVIDARNLAAQCQLPAAMLKLSPVESSRSLLNPELVDAEVLFTSMVRRMQLYSLYPAAVQTTEFCTSQPS